MAEFLDEVNGGFVTYTLADAAIEAIVAKRVYPDVAPQDESRAHLIYTQSAGHSMKSLAGPNGNETISLHVYAIGVSQPQVSQLARLVLNRWLTVNYANAAGTMVQVCNGGAVESGQWFPKDSSDEHMFFRRLLLNMLLGPY